MARRAHTIPVAIVVPPGAQTLDVVGPLDVFREATRQSEGRAAYAIQLIALEPGGFVRTDGLTLVPDASIHDEDHPIDTLLVAGTPHVADVAAFGDFHAWLRRRTPEMRRFGSVCTGVFFLGEAGLLTGRRVTTHWEDAAALALRYPSALVEPDKIYVKDGALYTSAGVTAGIDLALSLVEEDHGRELAMRVARRLIVFLKRPGGQSQFSQHLAAQLALESRVETIQHWILDHLTDELTIPRLAGKAGMSERNFSRIFLEETGSTPADFVEAARIEAARQLLEDTSLSLQSVAARCGFGSPDTMRRAFIRRIGTAPNEYRTRFASTT
ncbi:GlxA family transcriptional regulator [Aquabacter sp. CN5-332]|uniref:GlxA family transcriptional regulator n=1 Tax=Aquabacter sp. CN5-332 TaxID=3156608 RepID=UPI0032B377EE